MARKIFEYGGWIAGAVLIVFGVIAIAMGVNGRSEVRDALVAERTSPHDEDAGGRESVLLPPGDQRLAVVAAVLVFGLDRYGGHVCLRLSPR